MKKNFVEENETIVNEYHKSLGEITKPYTVPHEIIPYHGYLGVETAIQQKVMGIINETNESGEKKYKRILFIAPTGSGKTTLMANITHLFHGYSSIVEPNKIQNLQNQSDFDLEAIVGGIKTSDKSITPDKGYSIVYDLIKHLTNKIQENPSEASLIIIDEPQELYYAKTYRENALEQIHQLDMLSASLPNSTIIHLTATPHILVAEKYDYILIFEDVDRIPIAERLNIIENSSELSFEDALAHQIFDIVKNKKEKALIEIQSIKTINRIKNLLNSIGITTVSLSSEDKDNSKTFTNHKSGKLETNSDNDMFKAIIENSCLPKCTFSGKEIDVFLTTGIIGQGTSIKGIIDNEGNIERDIKLVPVYTVKDKPTCSIDYAMQFLARIRFHVNRAIVFVNKESYDAKVQQIISEIKGIPEISIKYTQTDNYHLSTQDKKTWKLLKSSCHKLGLKYKTYEELPLFNISIFCPKFETLNHIIERHIDTAKANLHSFTKIYDQFDNINHDIDAINQMIDDVLNLYCINGLKNSLNIIKRDNDHLYIDKEALWLDIYLDYIGQYYYNNDLYYQELKQQLEMPFTISRLDESDIDIASLKQQNKVSVYETISREIKNNSEFTEQVLKDNLEDNIKWIKETEEYQYLSAITKLTDNINDAYDIITNNDMNGIKKEYDNNIRITIKSLPAPQRKILESYALAKNDAIFLNDIAKLIIDTDYWKLLKRGLKLGVSMETLCYQLGNSKSFDDAKHYIDKTQTINLLKNYTPDKLKYLGRAGMEITIALGMFYDIQHKTFLEERNKVTKKDINDLRTALNKDKTIKSLRNDTSGIGKSGNEYTKKDAENLITCIFANHSPSKEEMANGVIHKLSHIAKSAK